jgi:hypothetical protein
MPMQVGRARSRLALIATNIQVRVSQATLKVFQEDIIY